ncbi:hypothetical protein ACJX0J_027418, partial [Zea mays]
LDIVLDLLFLLQFCMSVAGVFHLIFGVSRLQAGSYYTFRFSFVISLLCINYCHNDGLDFSHMIHFLSCMLINQMIFLLGFPSRGPEDTWFWCFLNYFECVFPIRCTNEKLNTDQLQAIIHRIADMAGHATYLRKGL